MTTPEQRAAEILREEAPLIEWPWREEVIRAMLRFAEEVTHRQECLASAIAHTEENRAPDPTDREALIERARAWFAAKAVGSTFVEDLADFALAVSAELVQAEKKRAWIALKDARDEALVDRFMAVQAARAEEREKTIEECARAVSRMRKAGNSERDAGWNHALYAVTDEIRSLRRAPAQPSGKEQRSVEADVSPSSDAQLTSRPAGVAAAGHVQREPSIPQPQAVAGDTRASCATDRAATRAVLGRESSGGIANPTAPTRSAPRPEGEPK